MGFDGVDVVDVCAVATGSLSAVAVSRSADLLWIRDTSENAAPVVIRPTHVVGAVYRVLASSRHLFVLTSKALYVWFDLVDRALAGQFASPEIVRLVLPVNAIDMSLLDDQYLLLVMGGNAVMSLAITDIESQLPGKTATEFKSVISSGRFEKTSLDDVVKDWQPRTPSSGTSFLLESLPDFALKSLRSLRGLSVWNLIRPDQPRRL